MKEIRPAGWILHRLVFFLRQMHKKSYISALARRLFAAVARLGQTGPYRTFALRLGAYF